MRTAAQETAPQISLRNCPKEAGGTGQCKCDFDEGGIHTIKHIFFQTVSSSFVRLLLIKRNSCHHKGFQCSSRYREVQDLGS